MLLKDFKILVDNFEGTFVNDDLRNAYVNLGLDTSNGLGRSSVTRLLYQNISDALKVEGELTDDKISKQKFLQLQTGLIYRFVILGEDPVEYLQILRTIQDSCRQASNSLPPFKEIKKWKAAIVACKNYNVFASTHRLSINTLRNSYPKEFDIATSLKALKQRGCEIELFDSHVELKSGLEDILNELESKVQKLGGIVLMDSLFFHLKNLGKYSKRFQRYFITREASGISFNLRPELPYGYLLNLSIKYPTRGLVGTDAHDLLQEIIGFASLVINGLYGVQPYNVWEFYFNTGETIIEFCAQIALWDSLFSIPQSRPSTAIEVCENLFRFISDIDFVRTLSFERHEFFSVLNYVLSQADETHSGVVIYHSQVAKRLNKIDSESILKILKFLSHNGPTNQEYTLPADYSLITFWEKPLLKLGETKFYLPNSSWSSPGVFEVLAASFRKAFKEERRDLDNELGKQLELFLRRKFKEKGISFVTGTYQVDGVSGECDFLIESSKGIILIEFKKKVLTRKAKSGVDINILLDLSDSLLSAQLQAGRTEILLRERGQLEFKDDDQNVIRVDWSGRQFERVALTQLEFGGFQDRGIVKQYLTSLLTHSFGTHSTDPNIAKKFKSLEGKQESWLEQYDRLTHLDVSFQNHPFFNCWFLSLAQLLEVINVSLGNEMFYEVFTSTKFITASTLDWYREFDFATSLKFDPTLS